VDKSDNLFLAKISQKNDLSPLLTKVREKSESNKTDISDCHLLILEYFLGKVKPKNKQKRDQKRPHFYGFPPKINKNLKITLPHQSNHRFGVLPDQVRLAQEQAFLCRRH
jgi:hypothetical protein